MEPDIFVDASFLRRDGGQGEEVSHHGVGEVLEVCQFCAAILYADRSLTVPSASCGVGRVMGILEYV